MVIDLHAAISLVPSLWCHLFGAISLVPSHLFGSISSLWFHIFNSISSLGAARIKSDSATQVHACLPYLHHISLVPHRYLQIGMYYLEKPHFKKMQLSIPSQKERVELFGQVRSWSMQQIWTVLQRIGPNHLRPVGQMDDDNSGELNFVEVSTAVETLWPQARRSLPPTHGCVRASDASNVCWHGGRRQRSGGGAAGAPQVSASEIARAFRAEPKRWHAGRVQTRG